ncbi:hypothetical protein BV22DRAFT_1134687 [Leucogyrophana mollusca]|uniref:Uncharacterized protein n=1 Tax=Leucogyrophana mollusca TaxID=85980 RepID=A0ACB8AYG1_9AGAM|nr:hypothetical protein BV22DRAFT_1134687 [Leucogyrophana mollusca]
MLFRPGAILLAVGICATRVVALVDYNDYYATFFSGPILNGSAENHVVWIGNKYPWDDRACGSCKNITKIPTGQLRSWSLGASCKVNIRFYGKPSCKSELSPTYEGYSHAETNVHGDIRNARSFEACQVE